MPYKSQPLASLFASYKLDIGDMPSAGQSNSAIEFTEASNAARNVVKLAEAVTRNSVDSLNFIRNLPEYLVESIYSTKSGGFYLCIEIIDSFYAMGQSLQKIVNLLKKVTLAAGGHLTSPALNFLRRIRQIITFQVQATEEMSGLLDALQERFSDPKAMAESAVPKLIREVEISLARIIAKLHPAVKAGDQMVTEAMAVSCEFLSQMGRQIRNPADG